MIPKNYFNVNSPNKDLYISATHMVKPEGKSWTCPLVINNIKHIKVYKIEYYNLKLNNYYEDIIVANNLRCDSQHLVKECIYFVFKNILYRKTELNKSENDFVMI